MPKQGDHATAATITLDVSSEVVSAIRELQAMTGDDLGDLFRKALGLYKLAQEAIRDGLTVGAAEHAGVLEIEFVGF